MTPEERYNAAMTDRDPQVYGWNWTPWDELSDDERANWDDDKR